MYKLEFFLKVHFWGVRGSIPAPLLSSQIQAKINACVQRITPQDLESFDSREKFIANLPDWIYGTVGSNSPCLQLITNTGKEIILDAGSGIRVMGKNSQVPEDNHFSLFFSHFHWDHICGLPFFDFAFNPNIKIDVYSPFENAQEFLAQQMPSVNLFPVLWKDFSHNFYFHKLEAGKTYTIDGIQVTSCKVSHPGGSYSYSFEENSKKFVYATDFELMDMDGLNEQDLEKVFMNADAVVLDSQYTLDEAREKEKWGHSAFCYAIDFAVKMNIKNVYLFHHDPTNDDKKLNSILHAAKWYASYISQNKINVELAIEGNDVIL